MNHPPAIAALEFSSIAVGMRAADAMAKKAPLDVFRIGTIHPGRFLVLVGGAVAAVEESRREGLRIGADAITDDIFLADVHARVVEAIDGHRRDNSSDALAIIETSSVPCNIAAADRAIKSAEVSIIEMRLGDDLGGKSITVLAGLQHDIEAAVSSAVSIARRPAVTLNHTIIPIQHPDLRASVRHTTEFHAGRQGSSSAQTAAGKAGRR